MNVLGKLFTSGASDLVKSVGGVIDNLTTSKEEKETLRLEFEKAANIHIEKLTEEANKEFELQTKDAQSARQRDIEANNSVNSSWLAKNINPVLALGCLGSSFALYVYCLAAKIDPQNKDVLLVIVGSLNTIQAGVISYYFGASKQRFTK